MFKEKRGMVIFILIGMLSGMIGAYLMTAVKGNAPVLFEAPVNNTVLAKHGSSTMASGSVADFTVAAEIGSSSVVFIRTISDGGQIDDFWSMWDFFGRRGPVSSAGSGVIVTEDGYIVTNNHVIDDADKIEVTLKNKHSYKAKVVGKDPNTDLALIKIEGKGFTPAVFANSDRVKIGEWVLAIGNPLNLTSTVTAGIVSARGRNINIVRSNFPIESFIQTDAAINPGNSGGALINLKGELIGVNTAIASKTGAYSGYGFAIPSNIVKKVIKDLTEFGQVQRAFLGAEVIDIDSELGDKLKQTDLSGVYTIAIEPDGAAEQAGLKKGDVIIKIDGVEVPSKAEYMERLSFYRPGESIKLQVKRGDDTKDLTIKLTNEDGTTELRKNESTFSNALGCSLTPLSKAERLKLKVRSGFRINNIRGGRIRSMGLPEGFIIQVINDREVESIEEIESLLTKTRGRVVIQGLNPNGSRGYYSFFAY